jgi:rfaE bifunctional protein nucleotidyltransferase chain/domain
MTSNKIVSLTALAERIAAAKARGQRVVQCHGCFDLVHPGHIKHLEAAKKFGDVLMVTLTPDKYVNKGPGRPVFNERLRAESLAALATVDFVAINEWPTAVEALKLLQPDVYVKGTEYQDAERDLTGKIRDEKEAVESVGGQLCFTDEITFSSTSLINAHFEVLTAEAQAFLKEFRSRHTAVSVLAALHRLRDLKILVVGEAIIDEYHFCRPLGRASKGWVITSLFLEAEQQAGGALAVARHLHGFSENVELLTVVGNEDQYLKFVRASLPETIRLRLLQREHAPTIVKRRFVEPVFYNKMFEVCFMDERHLSAREETQALEILQESLRWCDVALVCDFGHGFITPKMIELLTERAPFLAVNAQTNSANMGFNFITKYPRADYVCIDENELHFAMHDRHGPVEPLVMKLSEQMHCRKINITLGRRGTMFFADGEFHQIPILSTEVVDTIGAGDAFLSITTPLVFLDTPPELVAFVGNCVGALAVKIVGNRAAVNPIDLLKTINGLLK